MQNRFVTPSTTEKRVSITGSTRNSRKGKGRFDLIPPGPTLRLAQLYERGADNAPESNGRDWEKGQPLSWYLDSLKRHINDYERGDRTEDHLAAVNWNSNGLMWTEEAIKSGRLPAELDDLPSRATDNATIAHDLPRRDDKHTQSADSGAERQVEPPTIGAALREFGFTPRSLALSLVCSERAASDILDGCRITIGDALALERFGYRYSEYWLDIQRKRDEWEARQK